jgi:hypothetical protein
MNPSSPGGARETDTARLLRLAQHVELFHTPDGAGYADFDVNGHRETSPIAHDRFRVWLEHAFFKETKTAPGLDSMKSALSAIEAKARYEGPERPVYLRVASFGGKYYIDLADESWQAVEVDDVGWRVVNRPPVRFLRPQGMRPLPTPQECSNIIVLRRFLNVVSDADFVLVVSWLFSAMKPGGPYPVLVVSGEHGSAKSTFAKALRLLIDPNAAPLRGLPRQERDLFIAAGNGHVLAFDNLSSIAHWKSDALCQIATGGGFATRKNYTDQDEVLIDVARPVVLNGIEEIVTRPDLADRAVFITLEPIQEGRRRTESEFWAEFEVERPRILGALLDGMVEGLKRLPTIAPPRLPRMADFAKWGMACETASWPAGTFLAAYEKNRLAAAVDALATDPLAEAVRTLLTMRTLWKGTATELLTQLVIPGGPVIMTVPWLKSAQALSIRLRHLGPVFRNIGIEVSFAKEGHDSARIITITRSNSSLSSSSRKEMSASAASAASAASPKPKEGMGSVAANQRTLADAADGYGGAPGSSTTTGEPADRADRADATSSPRADRSEGSLTRRSNQVTNEWAYDDLDIPERFDRRKHPQPGDKPAKPLLN